MKMLTKYVTVAAISMMSWSVSAKIETIRFGTEASYAPFEYLNEKNEIVGFDIDVANALCETLQAKCSFNSQSFDSLIPSLRARRIDAAIAGIDVTPEREKQALFTQTYYQNSAMFITFSGDLTEIPNLDGKRIGVQNGTTHQKYLLEQFPTAKLVSYDSYNNAVLDMKNSRIDAVFLDSAVGDKWLEKEAQLHKIGDNVTNETYFGTGLAIAVRKQNVELQKALNEALATIKDNGTYEAIYQKWFVAKATETETQ